MGLLSRFMMKLSSRIFVFQTLPLPDQYSPTPRKFTLGLQHQISMLETYANFNELSALYWLWAEFYGIYRKFSIFFEQWMSQSRIWSLARYFTLDFENANQTLPIKLKYYSICEVYFINYHWALPSQHLWMYSDIWIIQAETPAFGTFFV